MPRFKRYKYEEWADYADDCYELDKPSTIAIDTETEGFEWDAPAFCVTVSWRSGPECIDSYYLDLDFDDHGQRLAVIRNILRKTPTWVFHNAKFDLQKLLLEDCIDRDWIEEHRIEDTNIMHALIDENDRHGLKYLAKKILREETNEEEVLKKVRRKLKIKKDEGYHLLPREIVAPYAMKDTEFTLRLHEVLRPMVTAQGTDDLYASEVQTAIAMLDIEAHGIGVDVPYLEDAASLYGKKVMRGMLELEKMTLDKSVPKGERKPFNPNSPKQITEAFERLGVDVSSTDKNALTALADSENENAARLAQTLLQYRKNKKLHSTYLVGMLDEQRDGVLHPNFNLTLPRTGRMSSSGATNN